MERRGGHINAATATRYSWECMIEWLVGVAGENHNGNLQNKSITTWAAFLGISGKLEGKKTTWETNVYDGIILKLIIY